MSKKCNVRTSCVLFFRKMSKKCNARTSCVLFFGKVSQNCNVRTSCVLFFGKVSQNCNVRCTTWYFEFGTVESWFVDWIRRWVKLGGVLPFFFSISSFVLFILTILAFMQIIPIFIILPLLFISIYLTIYSIAYRQGGYRGIKIRS